MSNTIIELSDDVTITLNNTDWADWKDHKQTFFTTHEFDVDILYINDGNPEECAYDVIINERTYYGVNVYIG